MSQPPPQPKIYHITNVDNLPGIIDSGGLLSDAVMIQRGGPNVTIGLSQIKQDRLVRPVDCHSGICVGDCVPFYFCQRSIMLFIIHKGNKPELTYHGGQGTIVHLEADLLDTVKWANSQGRHWAFSDTNARASYANFYDNLANLNQINWTAVASSVFTNTRVAEAKQAEFLIHESFPWDLVESIGVKSQGIAAAVNTHLAATQHRPPVVVQPSWYY